jgi:tetratricopeptide (TPR) repeat protein
MILLGDAMDWAFRLLPSLLLLSALFPVQLNAQQQLGKIIGHARVFRGDFPAHSVLISLAMRGTPIASVYTDDQGRFGFYSLVANEYTVSINDDSYEPFTQNLVVDPSFSPQNFISITLVPLADKKKQDPLQGRVAGRNHYLIELAEYYKHFPKKTIKEFEKGVSAEKERKVDDAIAHYLRAIDSSPDFYPAHNNLGSAYLGRQQFADARIQFEAAIKANQNDPEAHFNLANVMLVTKQYDAATLEIEEGMKRQPNSAFGQFLRGTLYSHTDRPELAEKSLQSAVNLDPKMAQAYLQLVNLYVQQRRTSDAINELEAYLKLFPEGPFSPKARDLLKRLQGGAAANR